MGLGVLEAALLLGILGDGLLRATPWGLNVFLWVGVLAAALLALSRRKRAALKGDGAWLLPAVIVFAAAFAWRDSLTLKLLDALSIAAVLSLAALRTRGGRVRLGGVTEYARGVLVSIGNTIFGTFPLLFKDIGWQEIPVSRARWSRHAAALTRGVAIALPLVLIFGALFMAADAVYDGLVRNTFNIDAELTFSHMILFGVFAWTSAGFLRGMFLGKELSPHGENLAALVSLGLGDKIDRELKTDGYLSSSVDASESQGDDSSSKSADDARRSAASGGGKVEDGTTPARKFVSLGIVEVGVVLGTLNALFFTFVVVQMRYFFGGAEHVLSSAGLTYSEYARRGFFELVCVAALVLPLLLGAHWLLRKERPADERIFRVLAGTQLFLLFVIMASAVGRMRLYQSEYGLTELRFYTTAFMGWLAVVFIWFALTVLRGERERFACGALVAALVVVVALHVVNPNDLIVRTNTTLAEEISRGLDVGYATSLGADAVPALIDALPRMKTQERRHVASTLLERAAGEDTDWRTWSWSRWYARRAVSENELILRGLSQQSLDPGAQTPFIESANQLSVK
jgi:hypothetical protein